MHPTLNALEREWQQIVPSAEAGEALRRWAMAEPVFAGADDLEAVRRMRLHPEHGPIVLTALARLAAVDSLAARTLLQALLPGLVNQAARVKGLDRNVIEDMVSLAWLRIRTYPTTRHGSVAGNVLLDVRKQYFQHQRTTGVDPRATLDEWVADPTPSPEETALARTVYDDLLAALCDGLISPLATRVIIRTQIEGRSLQEVGSRSTSPWPRSSSDDCARSGVSARDGAGVDQRRHVRQPALRLSQLHLITNDGGFGRGGLPLLRNVDTVAA